MHISPKSLALLAFTALSTLPQLALAGGQNAVSIRSPKATPEGTDVDTAQSNSNTVPTDFVAGTGNNGYVVENAGSNNSPISSRTAQASAFTSAIPAAAALRESTRATPKPPQQAMAKP